MTFFNIDNFFNLNEFEHKKIFDKVSSPWKVLLNLELYLKNFLKKKDKIYIGNGTLIDKSVRIEGSVVIGKNCFIGFKAYLRGPLLIGSNCKIINSEIKASILLNHVHIPHFSYIGDSIVGNNVNFGAGAKSANKRIDGRPIKIRINKRKINTFLNKFGAVIGDNCSLGANSVLNPGTFLEKNCKVFPLTSVIGYYKKNSIIK